MENNSGGKDNYSKYLITRNDLIQHRNGIRHVNIAHFMKANGMFSGLSKI